MNAVAPPRRGIGFWLGQLLPPLLIVAVLWTDSGPSFYFMAAMLLPVAIFSFFSLAWKLIRRREPARLLRPALALVLPVSAIVYASHSLDLAQAVVEAEAQRLQALCTDAGCPATTAFGNDADSRWGRAPAAPTHLRWPVKYWLGDPGFSLELMHGPDFSTRWEGGVAQPVRAFNVSDHAETPRPAAASGDPR